VSRSFPQSWDQSILVSRLARLLVNHEGSILKSINLNQTIPKILWNGAGGEPGKTSLKLVLWQQGIYRSAERRPTKSGCESKESVGRRFAVSVSVEQNTRYRRHERTYERTYVRTYSYSVQKLLVLRSPSTRIICSLVSFWYHRRYAPASSSFPVGLLDQQFPPHKGSFHSTTFLRENKEAGAISSTADKKQQVCERFLLVVCRRPPSAQYLYLYPDYSCTLLVSTMN